MINFISLLIYNKYNIKNATDTFTDELLEFHILAV